MLEARKRTGVDGKTWWYVFDTDEMKWSTLIIFDKYKLKRECQYAIDRYNSFKERFKKAVNEF